jgi:hypothetical protein
MGGTTRMSREAQVRICEPLGVQFPGATRRHAGEQTDRGMAGRKFIADDDLKAKAEMTFTHKSNAPPYPHALKVLAIRNSKIYVVDCPNLQATRAPIIYLDVEGIPSKQFYYLVGLRVCDGTSTTQHSFWADSPDDERRMWADCTRVLAAVDGARIVCFGQFDRTFLRRMNARYPDVSDTPVLIDELVTNSINVVSVIYGHVYFPTYPNGLKQIALFLDFHWTYPGASGLYALMWRSLWNLSRESTLKDRLIAYNIDDCKALELVFGTLAELANGGDATDGVLRTA